MNECGVTGCQHSIYAEGVCLWHYPLWETWGYEGGYEIYEKQGREEGRKIFDLWLKHLGHQQIVNILTHYDWGLTQAVNESIECAELRREE